MANKQERGEGKNTKIWLFWKRKEFLDGIKGIFHNKGLSFSKKKWKITDRNYVAGTKISFENTS